MLVAKLPRLNKHSNALQTRLLFSFIRSLTTSQESGQYWDYSQSHGPAEWGKKWPTGKRQSPIDLSTKTSKFDPSLQSFVMDKSLVQFKATNVGNNVSMTTAIEQQLDLKGGPLCEDVYRFGEMHMHWGEMNVCGCEHTVDGERFTGELHLVHWNTKYVEMAKAVDQPDGLAVLGVFLDAQNEYHCHPGMNDILDMFDEVHDEGSLTTSSQQLSPYNMLPAQSDAYFTYLGSLTTPPLYESVTWTVFMQAIHISMKQWRRLNTVTTSENIDGEERHCKQCSPSHHAISNNYRPVQELHDRIVRTSVQLKH